MNSYLQKKVDQSLRLLSSACNGEVVEVAYSGGKDSDVILELTKMAGREYRAIYKNTTIDRPKDGMVEIWTEKKVCFIPRPTMKANGINLT